MKISTISLLISLTIFCASGVSSAQSVTAASFADNRQDFFYDLFKESLENQNIKIQINPKKDLPEFRIFSMLEDGLLDFHWSVKSPQLDQKFLSADVPLTDNLIGKRIFLIRPSDQKIFDTIKSLDDLRATGLIGGFSQNWFDVEIWKANNLPVYGHVGNWLDVFKMVAIGGRRVDYLSRGVMEILPEAANYPDLAIEKNLLLTYEQDFRFYLSDRSKTLATPLTKGLIALKQNGRHAELMKRYFGSAFETLGVVTRLKIPLVLPAN